MSVVWCLAVNPQNVVSQYAALIKRLTANWERQPIVIKLNLSWTKFYPGCSTPPWQFEGVLRGLLEQGWRPSEIIPVENKTVVTNVRQGARNHFWDRVAAKYGVKIYYLPKEEYYENICGNNGKECGKNILPENLCGKLKILSQVFPQGFSLPKIVVGKPLISLATLKTHVFTTTTGVVKNYFGMLPPQRHRLHRFIHRALVELLWVQKAIHPYFAGLIDGVVAGLGAGPRAMEWQSANLILGSVDPVALDSVAARILGFVPTKIEYLRLAARYGLGVIKKKEIKVQGIDKLPKLKGKKIDTLASQGQKLIYNHLPWWAEKLLLQTMIAPWSYLASRLYYDWYWYNAKGRKRVIRFLKTKWGKLFLSYGEIKKD